MYSEWLKEREREKGEEGETETERVEKDREVESWKQMAQLWFMKNEEISSFTDSLVLQLFFDSIV